MNNYCGSVRRDGSAALPVRHDRCRHGNTRDAVAGIGGCRDRRRARLREFRRVRRVAPQGLLRACARRQGRVRTRGGRAEEGTLGGGTACEGALRPSRRAPATSRPWRRTSPSTGRQPTFRTQRSVVTTGNGVLRALLGAYQGASASVVEASYRVLYASLAASVGQQFGALAGPSRNPSPSSRSPSPWISRLRAPRSSDTSVRRRP